MESDTRTHHARGARLRAAGSDAARLLSLALGGLLLVSFVRAEQAPALELAIAATVAFASARPQHALLIVAALAPLAAWIAGALHAEVRSPEPLVLAFLTGWLLHDTFSRARPRQTPLPMRAPVALLVALVVAATAVRFSLIQVRDDFLLPFLVKALASLPDGSYFRSPDSGILLPLVHGMRWLEGLALFVAVVRLSRQFPALPRRLLVAVVAGAAGMAALNVGRLVVSSLATGGFLEHSRTAPSSTRISEAFADYNAAGSYFALALLLAAALASASGRFAAMGIVQAMIFGALLITGSRTALVGLAVAIAVGCWLRFRQRLEHRRRIAVAAAAGVLLLPLLLLYFYRPEDPSRTVSAAIQGRLELAAAAVRMVRDRPVFGVGPGRFYEESSNYISAGRGLVRPQENAHNNFLQILAELGSLGFASFAWLLIAVLARVRLAMQTACPDRALELSGAGILAFCVTWLAGHPLLVRETAFTFWVALALLRALADLRIPAPPAVADARRRRGGPLLLTVGIALILASVPFRARMEVAGADLSGVAIGLSQSWTDPAGRRFSAMAGRARFFVPAKSAALTIPLRVETGRVDVVVLVDGRTAAQLALDARRWQDVRVRVPARQDARFVSVEVRASRRPGEAPAGERAPIVLIGEPGTSPWPAPGTSP